MTQPEALRLAEHLEKVWHQYEAAAELRRLARVEAQRDALRAELKEATEAINDPAVNNLRTLPESIRVLCAQRDALLEALLRIESAVDWYLGRSSFTQTTQLKGLKHSANVRKELFAAHDEVRAAIKAVKEGK